MFTRTKDLPSIDSELETIRKKTDDIVEQIAQIARLSEHTSDVAQEARDNLERARARLRTSRESRIEEDAAREVARLEYQQQLEAELAKLEQDVPAQLERLATSQEDNEQKRIALHAQISQLQARGAQLVSQRNQLMREQEVKHQGEGEKEYAKLLQRFNDTAKFERTLVLRALEAKQMLAQKHEEAKALLRLKWPTLAAQFEAETAHIMRISQSETLDASEESLKLARTRKGGMVVSD